MASRSTKRPPSGPTGNAPRDVRDDFVGAPPDVIKAGVPLTKTRGPVRVKSNTFHASIPGNSSSKRADRAPHYRRGGWVAGYAKGGFVVKPHSSEVKEHRERSTTAKNLDAIEDKREDMPGVQKNDTSSDQNLRGKPVRFQDKPVFKPKDLKRKAKLADGGPVSQAGRFQRGGIAPGRRLAGSPGPTSKKEKEKEVPTYKGGGVTKRQFGGAFGSNPRDLSIRRPLDTVPGPRRADGGSVFKTETPQEEGRRVGRKIISQLPFNAKLRSESTENARATDRLTKDFDSRNTTGKYTRTYDEIGDDLKIREQTGDYQKGGAVKK